MNIDSKHSIAATDRSHMLGLLDSFADQCIDARDIGLHAVIPKGYAASCSGVVFAGLGGSAIGADLIRSYSAGEAAVPISVSRHYVLPGFVSSRTLVIASSYSGNTEETLAAFEQARKKGSRIIAITSGGTLARNARKHGFPVVTIPGGLPPRCALGYSFFVPLVLLWRLRLIGTKQRQIDETVRLLRELRDTRLGCGIPAKRNIAKRIARSIHGKLPVIYGGQDHIDSIVTRWRGQINENAKMLASSHILPEMNHNEIVGWVHPKRLIKDFVVIMLRDIGDHPRVQRRMDITRRIIHDEGVQVIEVHSSGTSLLARMFSLVSIGDYTSFYLALLNGQDPTPVDRITYLKKELAR